MYEYDVVIGFTTTSRNITPFTPWRTQWAGKTTFYRKYCVCLPDVWNNRGHIGLNYLQNNGLLFARTRSTKDRPVGFFTCTGAKLFTESYIWHLSRLKSNRTKPQRNIAVTQS